MRVLSAISGGADSVALLLLLHELHTFGDLRLHGALHLNHATRGDESDEDERFCQTLCETLTVPFVATRVDVPAAARANRLSIEIAARRARQQFFARVVSDGFGDVVATAHSEDDQAETVLLRIVRGTGGRGLGGIRPRRAHLIRPLLATSRGDLREWLTTRGQTWREDPTNSDLSNPRNRVRHELLPYLSQHFNPAVARALARLADLSRTDESWMEQVIDGLAGVAIQTTTRHQVSVDVSAIAAASPAIARRLARRALETANPERSYSVEDVDQLIAIAAGDRVAAEISGLRVERFRDSAVLVKRAPTLRPRRRGLGVSRAKPSTP